MGLNGLDRRKAAVIFQHNIPLTVRDAEHYPRKHRIVMPEHRPEGLAALHLFHGMPHAELQLPLGLMIEGEMKPNGHDDIRDEKHHDQNRRIQNSDLGGNPQVARPPGKPAQPSAPLIP